ncbi:hypothetical protein EDB19DRAFT_1913315 [Suillus lakei]|nr:hypothetical protein EDB19DRAFT_1913315 [Suillus lakei]
MHACLKISEILQVIFAKVIQVTASDVRTSYTYTTLYHLALTCRAFRELALDALWARIQTSDVLVMCLPQNARSESVKLTRIGDRDMSGISISRGYKFHVPCRVKLLRPLVDDYWAIFQKYARRVRSLTFEKYDIVTDRGLHDSAALALLDSHDSPSPSFPLLRELYWYDDRDVLLPCLQRCISTTLTRLIIHSELWPSAMVDLVAGVGKACPNIKEFRCSTPPASACATLSDIVTCWDDLEILEAGAVNARALKHLGSLKQLRELKMFVPEGYKLELTSTFSVIFSVNKISITAPRVKLLLAFLAPLQLSVKSAQLNTDTAPNAVDLDHLLSFLTEHFEPNVLESLNVGVARPTRFADYAPFQLTYFHLPKVLDFVSAWPQMEHLYLNTDWGRKVTRFGVTFRGLAGILERCPNLRSLGINLDTTTTQNLTFSVRHPYTGITKEEITDLSVGYAECNDVEAVDNVLAGMWPNLSYIHCACPKNPYYEYPSTS